MKAFSDQRSAVSFPRVSHSFDAAPGRRCALLIACGNELRGDDGVAHRVLSELPPSSTIQARSVLQLTPELAADIAAFETVVFLDADITVSSPTLEQVEPTTAPPTLTHICRPAEIVALARALFGFSGEALVCRLPAADFAPVAEERTGRRARRQTNEKLGLVAIADVVLGEHGQSR